MDRRQFLGGAVTATAIGLAGCSAPDDGDDDDGGGGSYSIGESTERAARDRS